MPDLLKRMQRQQRVEKVKKTAKRIANVIRPDKKSHAQLLAEAKAREKLRKENALIQRSLHPKGTKKNPRTLMGKAHKIGGLFKREW